MIFQLAYVIKMDKQIPDNLEFGRFSYLGDERLPKEHHLSHVERVAILTRLIE